jgi:hypothetical protein
MNIEYVPLLSVARNLQAMPRGMPRFRKYLRAIGGDEPGKLALPPLVAMNPMGREHVSALLDELLAIDADGIAAGVVAEVLPELADEPGDFRAALVVADDLLGGWTNRYAAEFSFRFPGGPAPSGEIRPPQWTSHFWITGVLWSSEPAAEQPVREAMRTAVYRTVYLQRHGGARTLRDMLFQEGWVMAQAGCTRPALEDDDIAYTREVIAPFLDATDMRTAVECLFGDAAGATLGFTPRGLGPWAGLALARHDARPATAGAMS